MALADDSVRRRKVGALSARPAARAQDLVDPLHYLTDARSQPFAEVIEAPLGEMLNAAPDVLVMADVGSLGDAERAAIEPWVEKGGAAAALRRPADGAVGRRPARRGSAAAGPAARRRALDRRRDVLGRAAQAARRSRRTSPFAGLPVPPDVDISSQVMAQPDPDLPERVLATLEDGTPLVTGKPLGDGRVVLFHVTANADWSSLPLSGLFVQMLERLTQSAGGLAAAPETLAGTIWTPLQVLDGFGALGAAEPRRRACPASELAEARPVGEDPAGIYAGGDRRLALNVMRDRRPARAAGAAARRA